MKIFKLIFAVVLVFLIFSKRDFVLPDCRRQNASLAIAPRIHYEQSIDGKNQPIEITRFFHNKIGVFGNELANCYFDVLSPVLMFQITGIFGLLSILFLLYFLANNKNYLGLSIIFLIPFLYFLNFYQTLLPFIYKGIAFFGLFKFLKFR